MNLQLLESRVSAITPAGASADVFLNNSVRPEIQDGPTCGLVAAKMVLDAMFQPANITVGHLLESGKRLGFTNNGEMFSADFLLQLVEEATEKRVTGAILSENEWNFVEICRKIGDAKSNCFLLVPYDCDKNFEPTLLSGSAAHWCLLVGFVSRCKLDPESGTVDQSIRWIEKLEDGQHLDEKNGYLLALHGKSRHPGVWSFQRLKNSNSQLVELGNRRLNDGKVYVLPPGGLQKGLAGKLLVIWKRKTSTNT